MSRTVSERLFGLVMAWTIFTTVFAWLPLVRLIARPEGYEWGLFGLRGEGSEGPYWVFIVLTAYAVAMLWCSWRGPRTLSYVLLLLWHGTLSACLVFASVASDGGATFQGQGLHFELPLLAVAVVAVGFTALVAVWVVLDLREDSSPRGGGWATGNTGRLVASLVLLPVAAVLFRLGTNYDWVTAAAIVVTVVHWILLAESFRPAAAFSRATTGSSS